MNNITFIGGGNMARCLIGGMIAKGKSAQEIRVVEPVEALRQSLSDDFNVDVFEDALAAIDDASCLVFAIKPQVFEAVITPLKSVIHDKQPLLVSIAAGITEPSIAHWLGGASAIIRCMPNTPALLGEGATALYANEHVSEKQKTLAEHILNAAGMTLWVEEESQLDAVTAVSGSGPAYFFAFIEAMQAAGEQLGLSSEQSKALTLQTALGAARMAMESDEPASVLRERVTSKGGTTAAALKSFEENRLSEIVEQALRAAHQRSIELGQELGK